MFESSLFESRGQITTRRGWTTTLSFLLQCFFVGIMVLIPLIYTEALPKAQLLTMLVAPPPPPPPPPPAAEQPVKRVKVVQTDIVSGQLRTPTKIPQKVAMIKEEEPPPTTSGVTGGVPGGVPGGSMGGVIGGIIGSTAPMPKIAAPQKIRVSSGVAAGNLINKVQPTYPQMAKMAHVQGTVVLHATISKNGTIENLEVVRGHPMLTQAALDAVRQWRYKPYYLNGEPVAVDTTIEVNFVLGG